jgi:type VI protein secretion system component VasK
MTTKQEGKSKQSSTSKDEEQKQTANKTEGTQSKHKQDETSEKNHAASKADSKKAADDAEGLDEGEELNVLLETFEDADLTEINLDSATGMIDEWYEILHKSKDAELKEIGNSLKQLKKVMSSNKSKGADIAEVLSQLGKQTDEYGNNAERGYKTKLHKLGKALTKAAHSLEKAEEKE